MTAEIHDEAVADLLPLVLLHLRVLLLLLLHLRQLLWLAHGCCCLLLRLLLLLLLQCHSLLRGELRRSSGNRNPERWLEIRGG